ncbi:MAG: choice-of-anchor D domain-containing protein, partial [Pseudomonadota bacterium]
MSSSVSRVFESCSTAFVRNRKKQFLAALSIFSYAVYALAMLIIVSTATIGGAGLILTQTATHANAMNVCTLGSNSGIVTESRFLSFGSPGFVANARRFNALTTGSFNGNLLSNTAAALNFVSGQVFANEVWILDTSFSSAGNQVQVAIGAGVTVEYTPNGGSAVTVNDDDVITLPGNLNYTVGGTEHIIGLSQSGNGFTYTNPTECVAPTAPEIDVSSAVNGAIVDSGTDNHGSRFAGQVQTITYTVNNTGTATLNVTDITTSGAINITGSPTFSRTAFTVAPGGSETFDLMYTPTNGVPYSFNMDIINDDALDGTDETNYDIAIAGLALVDPEIEVSSSETGPLADGGTDNNGNQPVGVAKTVTYTVSNTGNANLNFSSLSISNVTNATINLFTFSASSALPGGSATLTVTYTPTNSGPFSFDVQFNNNDPDETPFDFTITGTGTAPPTVSLLVDTNSVNEGAAGMVTVTARANTPAPADITVVLGFSGDATGSGPNQDFSRSSSIITILNGSTEGTTQLTIVDDAVDENDELIVIDIIAVSGGGATEDGTQQQIITIVDDESPPEITSDGGGDTAAVSVTENTTAVTDVQTTDDSDSEGAGLTYSLTTTNTGNGNGVDNGFFTLNATTGVLTFTAAPDFENRQDNDSNNVYDVQVTVTDSGGLTDVQDIAVTVTDDVNADVSMTISEAPDPVVAGQMITYTVDVMNTGTGEADDVRVTITLPADVTPSGVVIANLGRMAAGATDQFQFQVTVNNDAASPLTTTATVTTTTTETDATNNDASSTLTVISPEIEVSSSVSGAIADGGTDAQGNRVAGTPVMVTYTVTNSGTDTLTLTAPVIANQTNVAASVSTALSSTNVAPLGGTATFTVTYTPTLAGVFSFDIDVANNDADENPYDVTVSGTGTGTPDIEVSSSVGGPMMDDDVDGQGNQMAGVPVMVTYTVTNSGTDTLTLTAPTIANQTNVAASVSTALSSTNVAPAGGTATFTV